MWSFGSLIPATLIRASRLEPAAPLRSTVMEWRDPPQCLRKTLCRARRFHRRPTERALFLAAAPGTPFGLSPPPYEIWIPLIRDLFESNVLRRKSCEPGYFSPCLGAWPVQRIGLRLGHRPAAVSPDRFPACSETAWR